MFSPKVPTLQEHEIDLRLFTGFLLKFYNGNVYHVRLCRIRLPTLALKPKGDVTRSPKQGNKWPQKWTCVQQKFNFFFKNGGQKENTI